MFRQFPQILENLVHGPSVVVDHVLVHGFARHLDADEDVEEGGRDLQTVGMSLEHLPVDHRRREGTYAKPDGRERKINNNDNGRLERQRVDVKALYIVNKR